MNRYRERVIVSSLMVTFLLFGFSNPVVAGEKGKGNGSNGKQASGRPSITTKQTSGRPSITSKPTIDQMIQHRVNIDVAVAAFVSAYTQSKIARAALNDLEKNLQPALKIATDNAIAVARTANSGSGKQRVKTKVNIDTIKKTVLSNFLLAHPELVVAQNAVRVADANLVTTGKMVNAAQKTSKTAANLFDDQPEIQENNNK